MENKQEQQASILNSNEGEIALIKPLQATEQPINDQDEPVVVENIKLSSVPVNDDKPITAISGAKKAKRHMKMSTTKKTKLPVKK